MKEKTIYALGFFDGVHLGHQTILYACKRIAEQTGATTGAITFEDHPQSLFVKDCPGLINTTADRCSLLRQYGMDTILTYPVTRAVMGMPWREFLMELYRNYGAAGFVCGDDFRFGHKGEGNCDMLREFCKEFGLPCIVVPEQTLDGSRISSTRIRALLEQGDMENVNRLLGHPYALTGKVTAGQQLGRTLGFPTANIPFPAELAAPKFGVYISVALIGDGTYAALTNLGVRPTVNGDGIIAEVHLLDFDGDLYGQEITVAFHRFLRPEKKFHSIEELKAQIGKDVARIREML
ncbi:MAG: bifunctional riboflavin kinase/FAD synthetase [Oscillospiraceae bacterium]|nr:bifunctional riboflavin kinase/FAD synthetase [Oscillospiraceae bacterium]